MNNFIESDEAGGAGDRLRKTGSGTTLLCGMCKVRTESSFISHQLTIRTLRYYETDSALRSHWKSKVHKRRCKELKEPAYTIEESELAAGLGRDDKRAVAPTTEDAMSQ